MAKHLKNANSKTRKELPTLDWMYRGNTFLNTGQPLPTGLEGLETISSTQKVLQWLEAHFPSEPGTLDEEDEDWENNIDKEQSQQILEEDITCPAPSETCEEYSQGQECQDVSEKSSDQELFQQEEDESTAETEEATSNLQSTSPALASSVDTKGEPAMSPRRASPQQGQAAGTTPTSTDPAPSAPSWKEPPVSAACLLPSQPLGDKSLSPTAIHTPVQPRRQSLLRRALRAVSKVFLGTQHPQEQEQQRPAPSTRQVPGEGCSEPQRGPLTE